MPKYLIYPIIGVCIYFSIITASNAYCSSIMGYSTDQWANAIYWAEGGNHAVYLYGIRSIQYDSKEQARHYCINTVQNDWRRFKRLANRGNTQFIEFLQSRYCPNTRRYPAQGERWKRNVIYYLKHPKSIKGD